MGVDPLSERVCAMAPRLARRLAVLRAVADDPAARQELVTLEQRIKNVLGGTGRHGKRTGAPAGHSRVDEIGVARKVAQEALVGQGELAPLAAIIEAEARRLKVPVNEVERVRKTSYAVPASNSAQLSRIGRRLAVPFSAMSDNQPVVIVSVLDRTCVTDDHQLLGFGRVLVDPDKMIWESFKASGFNGEAAP